MPNLEVLLISIDWECPEKVRAVIPSKRKLKASKVNGNSFEYDIVLYNKEDQFYFQFAVKTKLTPYLKTNEDKWSRNNTLYNVHEDLWIIKGDWKLGQRGIGYHHCPSINTIGKIKIGLSENHKEFQQLLTIDINSNIQDFDFTQLKNDFEGDLWNLITSNKSNVTLDKIELQHSNKVFRYAENRIIVEFIKAFDSVAKNPKRELSYSKELRRTEMVIPIVETYRKLTTTGQGKLLPSKAVVENYDIYENQFICFMLQSVYSIVSKNIKYTSQQTERLNNEIATLIKKISILQDPDPKVNQREILDEIETQKRSYNKWIKQWEINKKKFLANYANEGEFFRTICIEIIHNTNNTSSYWVSLLNGPNGKEYCLFEFNNDCSSIFEGQKAQRVTLSAYYFMTGLAGNFNKYTVKAIDIDGITIDSINEKSILEKQISNYNILETNNWSQLSIISYSDRNNFIRERNNQITTLKNRVKRINHQIENIVNFNKEQSNLYPLLEQRLKTSFFKSINWKKLQRFKPSMTFIQNIAYRNTLRYYREILQSEGIDIEIFDLYESITSYGIREMPQVYELWCLITQIKILEESFHFTHNPKDLSSLLKTIDPRKQTIVDYSKIEFNNNLAGRTVTIHYQRNINTNKRPDFVLEVSCNNKTINLILDSKFKNYNYKKSIIYEAIDMKNKYGGGENYVFILHPCKDGTFEDRSIKYTNHGGQKIFYGKEAMQEVIFPFHEYGYIELKPGYTDMLKKLIAMTFEYLLEPSRIAEDKNPKPENKIFCINCGGDSFDIQEGGYKSGGKFYKYTCTSENNNLNQACGHEINISYCWNCKAKLFKHGSYWDYHLQSSWSIFDIHCPSCGMTVADRPMLNRH